MDRRLEAKFRFFEEFWKGQGPCPILFARPHLARDKPYACHDLVEQHRDAGKQLEERLLEIEPHLRLVDDGIPTFRADLGTTLLPSGLGLRTRVQPELHPWLEEHLEPAQILALSPENLERGEVVFAREVYRLFLERRSAGTIPGSVFPYVPDTQGIFDLSHLLAGSEILLLAAEDPQTVRRIQERSLQVFLAGTWLFKRLLGEQDSSMIHGHGMPIGVWFPRTGARISEDSCTLISESMIQELWMPYLRQAARPFGALFLHYCGCHPGFLRLACEAQEISALNLGNPEAYDLEELFAQCGRSGTVYFGHLPRLDDEDGEAHLERLAALAGRHGTRLILVSEYRPGDDQEKSRLVERWHRLTRPRRA
jgi:hypothetical protein